MTYNKEIAKVEPRSQEEWLNLILEDGTEYWGDDIAERENTAVHQLYQPYAGRLAELEQQLKEVHEGLRLDTAEGQELDYLGKKLGVDRREDKYSSGKVTFSRSTNASKDYLIQEGTIVETGSIDSIEFATTEKTTLSEGSTSTTVSIEARSKGSSGNVAADTITEAVYNITGVEQINNSQSTDGGRDVEKDDPYRKRIKTAIGEIDVTSGQYIFNQLSVLDYVKSINYIDNSSDSFGDGLNAHEVELVIDAEPGHSDEIAQIIFNNMAMGANLVNGVHGAATSGSAALSNGQTFTIPYSEPTRIDIYIQADITIEEDVNKDLLKNSIVEYIGGTKTNGEQILGGLSVGENVVHGEVDFSLREIENVFDITSLSIDKSSSPSGTSNISISTNERATISHSNISINLTVK